jgi:hypothetical protein
MRGENEPDPLFHFFLYSDPVWQNDTPGSVARATSGLGILNKARSTAKLLNGMQWAARDVSAN